MVGRLMPTLNRWRISRKLVTETSVMESGRMTETRYIKIGAVWECQDCDVEGQYGRIGILLHEIRHHKLS